MAVYKRYDQRRRRAVRNFCIWLAVILVIFAATALLGAYLGRRAETAPAPHKLTGTGDLSAEVAAPIAEHIVHGEFVTPDALTAFTGGDDPYAHASVWLYRDGAPTFATETDAKLGRDTTALPPVTALAASNITGLFEVRSIYADAQIRDVRYAYELALLKEYAAADIGEITLVFDRLDSDCLEDVLRLASACPGAVALCVPFDTLASDVCTDFFTAAGAKGWSVALRAGGIRAETLAESIEDYAFYFTKYSLRLVLEGSEEGLLDVLREKSLQSYQFCSARPAPAADTAETTQSTEESK